MPDAFNAAGVKRLRCVLGTPKEVAEMLRIPHHRLLHVEAYGGPDTTLIGLALRTLVSEAEQKPKSKQKRSQAAHAGDNS